MKRKLQLGSYDLLLSSGKEMGSWWCLVKTYYFVVTLHKLEGENAVVAAAPQLCAGEDRFGFSLRVPPVLFFIQQH